MSDLSKKDLRLLRKLFAMLGSERDRPNAWQKIDDILKRNRKTWNDLTELVVSGGKTDDHWNVSDDERTDPATFKIAGEKMKDYHALDLLHHILGTYLDMKPHEYVAVALWVLHSHVYIRSAVTPRLALTSPVRGCGKSTVLRLLDLLGSKTERMDGVSPAAIYHLIEDRHPTLLVDEADNLGLATNNVLRAVMNSGHLQGGEISRYLNGHYTKLSTFAPMAIASIGTLPLPLMHRSIVVHMERTDKALKRLPLIWDSDDTDDRRTIDYIYDRILKWAKTVKLTDPDVPKELRNRQADNWRPLLAIADTFGPTWAAEARKAALVFARTFRDEDAGVILLDDIRSISNQLNVERIASEDLIARLLEQDANWSWSEWRGMRDDQQPKKLSQGEMARLLRPFGIRPRSIRFKGDAATRKGYQRAWFESAWAKYCDELSSTPAQPREVIYVDRRQPGTRS